MLVFTAVWHVLILGTWAYLGQMLFADVVRSAALVWSHRAAVQARCSLLRSEGR